ncbi:MAG: hypothetical protein K8R10_08130 [Rhodocyclales bacterium]|nr:hypothetical protein [Rhodocyclales bacterium]
MAAAILKWLEHTDEKAVVMHSRAGFTNWSWSSQAAFKAGAFFKTKRNVIPLPAASLGRNHLVVQEKAKRAVAEVWFQYAEDSMSFVEMKLASDHSDSTLSLLLLLARTTWVHSRTPKPCDFLRDAVGS